MKINWKVRIKNKLFWTSLVSALILLLQAILKLFGVEIDLGKYTEQFIIIVNYIFGVLAILGIVTDPTTSGIGDSTQALTYTEPKKQ